MYGPNLTWYFLKKVLWVLDAGSSEGLLQQGETGFCQCHIEFLFVLCGYFLPVQFGPRGNLILLDRTEPQCK